MGANVVASVLAPSRVAGLEPAIGVVHPHAAAILALVEDFEPDQVPSDEPPAADAKIVVAEYIEGRSLQQRLDAGPVALESAVEWATSAADALSTLHARGAVHGAVSPRSILVVRREPAVVPTLTHLLVPPSGAYCSPERVTGEGPSKADDVWALAATLYNALARRPPFQGASRTELARAIVAAAPAALDDIDLDLWAIVGRALSRDPRKRFEDAGAVRDALREWTETTGRHSVGDFAPVEAMIGVTEEPPNVGDLSLVAALSSPESAEARAPLAAPSMSLRPSLDPDAHSDPSELRIAASPQPRPVASGSAPVGDNISTSAVVASSGAPRPRRRGGGAVIAGAVAAVAAAAGLLVYATKGRPNHAPLAATPSTVETAATPSARTEPSLASPERAPSSSAVAVAPGPSAAAPTATAVAGAGATPGDVSACAAATLPESTAGPSPDLGFLCTETDLWGITRKVNQQVLHHGTGSALVLWAHLGRFDLAAVALVRRRCCPDGPAFTAATPKGLCDTLTSSIEALASDPAASSVDRYAADVDCLVSHGVRYPAEWWDRLTAKEARSYFEQFVGELRSPAR